MQTHRFYGDPRLLRQWIKEMENRVARVPSVTETKRLSIEQLQKLAVDHGVSSGGSVVRQQLRDEALRGKRRRNIDSPVSLLLQSGRWDEERFKNSFLVEFVNSILRRSGIGAVLLSH